MLESSQPGRYNLHSIIQTFAREKLAADDEALAAGSERHARYFGALLATQTKAYFSGRQQSVMEIMSSVYENVRIELDWALTHKTFDLVDEMWLLMYLYLWERNRFAEGRDVFEWITDHVRQKSDQQILLGKVLIGLAEFHLWLVDYERAEALLAEGRPLLKGSAEARGTYGQLLELSGRLFLRLGDYVTARYYLKQSRAIYRKVNFPHMLAQVLNTLGNVICYQTADYDHAMQLYEEALEIYRGFDDQNGISKVLLNIGVVALERGEFSQAATLFQSSLDGYLQVNYGYGIWAATNYLATALSEIKDFEAARLHVAETLTFARNSGNLTALIGSLSQLSTILLELGEPEEAMSRNREALRIAMKLNVPHQAINPLVAAARLAAHRRDPQTAVAVLAYVKAHQSEGQEASRHTEALIAEIGKDLSNEEMAAAMAWCKGQKLANIVRFIEEAERIS